MTRCILPAFAAAALLLAGCQSYHAQHIALTGVQAPPEWGKIRVYATSMVPFEFEEIGFVQIHYEADPGAQQDFSDKAQIGKFIDKAREMGADAILNFRAERVGTYWNFSVTGVAVKIKKP